MKVIAFCIPSLGHGGAERVIINLANYYARNNYFKVYILTRKEGEYQSLVDKSVHIIDIYKKKPLFFPKFLYSLWEIFFICKTIDANILFSTLPTTNIKCSLVKSLLRNKIAFISREANIVFPFQWKLLFSDINLFVIRSLYKYVYQTADLIIANSYDTKTSIIGAYKVKENKIKVLSNPVFSQNIFNAGEIETNSTLMQKKYILAVGRLTPQKDFETLIQAFKIVCEQRNEDIHLIILGEGELRNELERLIRNLGLEGRIHLPGFISNVYPYYKNCSLFVLSSIFEGFGNVLVEALAFGKPIVSTRCSGGPNFILDNGKYGILVDVGDCKALAEAIISILSGANKFIEKQQKERGMNFSIEEQAEKYYQMLNICVN